MGEEDKEENKEKEAEEGAYFISNNFLNTGNQASSHICISEVRWSTGCMSHL